MNHQLDSKTVFVMDFNSDVVSVDHWKVILG